MMLARLNLKRPDTVGFVQQWYGYDRTGRGADIVWTPRPEPLVAPEFTVVVETDFPDEVLVRAELMLRAVEGTL